MNELFLQSWWMLALRGAIALLFGVLAVLWPGITLLWLAALFAAYALIGGAVSVIGAVKNRKSDEEWWLILLLGLVSLGAGVIAVLHPAGLPRTGVGEDRGIEVRTFRSAIHDRWMGRARPWRTQVYVQSALTRRGPNRAPGTRRLLYNM
jgi:uncharacterized membrane protein HdeD (DUF308 family)